MRVLIVAAGALGLLACASPGGSGCAGQAPEQTLQAIIDADNARDLDTVMEFYTEDVVWLSPRESTPLRGRDSVEARYTTLYSNAEPHLSGEAVSVDADDRVATVWGYTTGALVQSGDNHTQTAVNDVYMASLRCERGRWRVSVLMWRPR